MNFLQQSDFLKDVDETPFFNTTRLLTLLRRPHRAAAHDMDNSHGYRGTVPGQRVQGAPQGISRSIQVACHGTSLAVESNNVTLDPDVKDAWGLQAIRVTYTDHPADLANARFLQDRGADNLSSATAAVS